MSDFACIEQATSRQTVTVATGILRRFSHAAGDGICCNLSDVHRSTDFIKVHCALRPCTDADSTAASIGVYWRLLAVEAVWLTRFSCADSPSVFSTSQSGGADATATNLILGIKSAARRHGCVQRTKWVGARVHR